MRTHNAHLYFRPVALMLGRTVRQSFDVLLLTLNSLWCSLLDIYCGLYVTYKVAAKQKDRYNEACHCAHMSRFGL